MAPLPKLYIKMRLPSSADPGHPANGTHGRNEPCRKLPHPLNHSPPESTCKCPGALPTGTGWKDQASSVATPLEYKREASPAYRLPVYMLPHSRPRRVEGQTCIASARVKAGPCCDEEFFYGRNFQRNLMRKRGDPQMHKGLAAPCCLRMPEATRPHLAIIEVGAELGALGRGRIPCYRACIGKGWMVRE